MTYTIQALAAVVVTLCLVWHLDALIRCSSVCLRFEGGERKQDCRRQKYIRLTSSAEAANAQMKGNPRSKPFIKNKKEGALKPKGRIGVALYFILHGLYYLGCSPT